MADIFISYTSNDRDWAFWIGQQLEQLGHVARVHEWEIGAGGDIARWMEERHQGADHILCVVSAAYLSAPYSGWERRAAQWAATTNRPNFALPVFVEPCEPTTLLAPIKRCDLHGLDETRARERLADFLSPAVPPTGPVPFPGTRRLAAAGAALPSGPVAFPGKPRSPDRKRATAIFNIPLSEPRHFLGRDEDLAAIDSALRSSTGRAAVSALHGLRGVGKTTLAATYAERRRDHYRATWWIRAETESTTRADLVGLGVQLGWFAGDVPEELAVREVLERIRAEGEGVLLVYDNAVGPRELAKFLPRSGSAHIIITSNAPNWGAIAAPVEIDVWPSETGADFLMARTRRTKEHDAALALSEALGGLPLAHEQAAAYCDRVGVSLAAYRLRFETAPVVMLDDAQAASQDYGRTVAKTFALAIDEAAKRHPAAEPLLSYAALLAPEPIPLYLFSEGRGKFDEPFPSAIDADGLDEAVAALRSFALLDRESIADERDPSITTDCIRLHRLVRQVAAARKAPEQQTGIRRELIEAMQQVYPAAVHSQPGSWARARRLDALAIALVGEDSVFPEAAEPAAWLVLNDLGTYRFAALAAHADARPLLERALVIAEKVFGPDHPYTATSLNNLGLLLQEQGDLAGARPCYERALAISERVSGTDQPDTAISLNSLGYLLHAQGDFEGARTYYERGLAICEKVLGQAHPDTATHLNDLGRLLRELGDLTGARTCQERALKIYEDTLGPDHPHTAISLSNLSYVLRDMGDPTAARSCCERALTIRQRTLGSDHPETAESLKQLSVLLQGQGDLAAARPHCEGALAAYEKRLGANHPDTRNLAANLLTLLDGLGLQSEAQALSAKFNVRD